jgi:hypothetical protein
MARHYLINMCNTNKCTLYIKIKVIHTSVSAFVGITCMNEIHINARYGTQRGTIFHFTYFYILIKSLMRAHYARNT